ncbi:MAG: hypothetical protein KAT68_01265 [Bacteroidales bacterium]|nr:hypothetical protein [Bacteroidales bacterium]
MNQFTERYKSYSNAELLKIIENSSNYQPEAVETAKNEIEQRQLTDKELKEAELELETQRQEKIKKNERRQNIENKVKEFGTSIVDTVNPIQQTIPTAQRLIRLITIMFGLISLYQFYKEFGILKFMFGNNGGIWDFSIVFYFLPLFLVPTATILFWFRKKLGWILLGTYLTYSAVNSIGLLIQTWNMEPIGIPAFDDIFPQTSPITYILTFLFFVGTMWVISKENVREIFAINRKTMMMTIGIVSILTIVLFVPYL